MAKVIWSKTNLDHRDGSEKRVDAYLASEGKGDESSRSVLLRYSDWLEESGEFQIGL